MQVRELHGRGVDRPVEWTPYLLVFDEVPLEHWESARVDLNGLRLDVHLRRVGSERQVVAEWPRAGPGRYRVTVSAGSIRLSHNVDRFPAKLSEDGFNNLICELQDRLPFSIVLALTRAGAPMAGVDIESLQERSLENELTLVRRAIQGAPGRPGLPALLQCIGRAPHKSLEKVPWTVRTVRARRPSAAALRRAVISSRGQLDDDDLPLVIEDRRTVVTYDTAENQLLKGVVDTLRRRLNRLEAARHQLGGDAQEDLSTLRQAFDQAVRSDDLLCRVSPMRRSPDRPSMTVMRDSRYRAVYRLWQELTRQFVVTADEPRPDAPLNALPELYERWGALVAVEALLEVARERGWTVTEQRLVERRSDGVYVRFLRDGAAMVSLRGPEGQRADLVSQRSFSSVSRPLRSTSLTQRPDLVLDKRAPDGTHRLLVLDPKYKLDGEVGNEAAVTPKKIDIDKMHAYRDAIVLHDSREAVVDLAATIYPGPDVRYETVEALSGKPDRTSDLRDQLADRFASFLD